MKAKKLYRRIVFSTPEGTINSCIDDSGGFVFYSNAQEVVDDLEQRIAELEQQMNRTCEWVKLSMTGKDDYWQSHCVEHGAKSDVMLTDRLSDYCPNCGGKVEVE
jgi:hypothetical protein